MWSYRSSFIAGQGWTCSLFKNGMRVARVHGFDTQIEADIYGENACKEAETKQKGKSR